MEREASLLRQPSSGQQAPMSVCHIGDQYDVDANIGVHEHEHGRVQRLVVDISIETGLPKADTLNATPMNRLPSGRHNSQPCRRNALYALPRQGTASFRHQRNAIQTS